LSRSQRSAVYIIAMNVARHDRRARFGVKDRGIFRPLCSHATEPRISIHFAPVADVPDVLIGPEIHIPRSAAVDSNAKYILSKDRGMRHNVGLDSVVLRRSHRDPPTLDRIVQADVGQHGNARPGQGVPPRQNGSG